jgi:hypothetical protein
VAPADAVLILGKVKILPTSIRTPLVIVARWRVAKPGIELGAIPVDLDIADVTIHKADLAFGVVKLCAM